MNFGITFAPLVPLPTRLGGGGRLAVIVMIRRSLLFVVARSRGACCARAARSRCSCWRSPIRRSRARTASR